ncbi:MAG: haloalkane dehalogenase [Oligoflexus sp.]
MKVLSTPEDRFQDLQEYPFKSHFLKVEDGQGAKLNMHYLDEGPKQAEVILLLHGEPTWSYLYRDMVAGLKNEYRVIAPDLIGFGKSDKFEQREDYTYASHISWVKLLLDGLNLSSITMFCQDWGGLIGLRLLAQDPSRFLRVVAANTFLPTGEGKPSSAFLEWRDFSQNSKSFSISKVIASGCTKPLSDEALRAYDAPYPDESYKAGARAFPALVPIYADDPEALKNREAWQILKEWKKPFLTAFSDQDPITRGGDKLFQSLIPGCQNQNHTTVQGAGHFLQEDNSAELVDIIDRFIKANPRENIV